MSKPILGGLFEIEDPHQLRLNAQPDDTDGIPPYTSYFFRELDEEGNPVCTYRYWEAADGAFYGAESYTLDGSMIQRRHCSREQL
ncbi:hypothetical protein QQM79_06500 [Marinobacteraceae bacterium S3BR75-40.1]